MLARTYIAIQFFAITGSLVAVDMQLFLTRACQAGLSKQADRTFRVQHLDRDRVQDVIAADKTLQFLVLGQAWDYFVPELRSASIEIDEIGQSRSDITIRQDLPSGGEVHVDIIYSESGFTLHNFHVFDGVPGLGSFVFTQMVKWFEAAGVDRIYISAKGGGEEAYLDEIDEDWRGANGYYTFVRWGADGNLPRDQIDYGVTNTQELRQLENWADFWRRFGAPIELEFVTSANSASRRVLDAYLEERQLDTSAIIQYLERRG